MTNQHDLDKILEARRAFLNSLSELGLYVEQRIGQLKELLEYSAQLEASKLELSHSCWHRGRSNLFWAISETLYPSRLISL